LPLLPLFPFRTRPDARLIKAASDSAIEDGFLGMKMKEINTACAEKIKKELKGKSFYEYRSIGPHAGKNFKNYSEGR
jgi:hypothetical protein